MRNQLVSVAIVMSVVLLLGAYIVVPAITAMNEDSSVELESNFSDEVTITGDTTANVTNDTSSPDLVNVTVADNSSSDTVNLASGDNETASIDSGDVDVNVSSIDDTNDKATVDYTFSQTHGWGNAGALLPIVSLFLILGIGVAVISVAMKQV